MEAKFWEAVESKLSICRLYREILSSAKLNFFEAFKELKVDEADEVYAELESIVAGYSAAKVEELQTFEDTFRQENWKVTMSFKLTFRSIHRLVLESTRDKFFGIETRCEPSASKMPRIPDSTGRLDIATKAETPKSKYSIRVKKLLDEGKLDTKQTMKEKLFGISSKHFGKEVCKIDDFALTSQSDVGKYPLRCLFKCPAPHPNAPGRCGSALSCSVKNVKYRGGKDYIVFCTDVFTRHLKLRHKGEPAELVDEQLVDIEFLRVPKLEFPG